MYFLCRWDRCDVLSMLKVKTSIDEEHAVCSNSHFNTLHTHIRYKTKYVYNIFIRNITVESQSCIVFVVSIIS